MRSAHLGQLIDDVRDIVGQIRRLSADLSANQLAWKPGADRWSVLECIEHLRVTGERYNPRIREAIGRARERETAPSGDYRPSWFGRVFIGFVSPDSKRRLRAPKAFRPTAAELDPALVDGFLAQEGELEDLIRHADGYELNRIKFASPITRFIRFSIGEGLTLMVTHQRRHLRQARRVTKLAEFPRDS